MSEIDRVMAEAIAGVERVHPDHLDAEVAAGALVVDTRPEADRRAAGEMPGAVVLERNVLEWRLDPTSPDRIAEADGPHRRIVLVCNEGYATVLAAESLRRLGLTNVTDLEGGYRAWRAACPP